MVKAATPQPSEPLPLTRPGFPVFTVIGTICLVILAAVTLIRNRHQEPAAVPTSAEQGAPVVAEKSSSQVAPAKTPATLEE